MSTSLLTGLSNHPMSFAQLGDVVAIMNGHDANKIYNIRDASISDLGLSTPAAAATPTDQGAGNVTGAVKYRIRWKDSTTNTISLPSNPTSHTTTSQIVRLAQPASPPTRATHWIVERTLDANSKYFPVNITASTPHGTVIATTTFDDDETDSTIRNRIANVTNQGVPQRYQTVAVNGAIMFAFGGRVHHISGSVLNGSPNVNSPDGNFNSDMIGQDFSADGETDGVTYKILSITNADNLVLEENYAGSEVSADPCTIAGVRDHAAWSIAGSPEYWGELVVGGLSNEVRIGDDGEPIVAGIGLGTEGFLYCKESRMYVHAYRRDPKAISLGGDGRIVPLQSRRGAFSNRSIIRVEGFVYGMDQYGIWQRAPGSEPVEIGREIAAKYSTFDLTLRDKFWIDVNPATREIYFYVVETGYDYPRTAYIWDLDRRQWTGTIPNLVVGRTCGLNLTDTNMLLRHCFFTEKATGGAAYFYFQGIGDTSGVPPGATLSGAVTSGSSTSITATAATFPTSGEGCDGAPVTLIRAADDSEETAIILSNTGTILTTTAFTGTAPTSGDTFRLGPIESSWKTGRINFGEATRKKKVRGLWLWIKFDAAAVDFSVKAYYDGKSTAEAYAGATATQDGVTYTLNSAKVTIDPGATNEQSKNIHRQWIDLPGDKWLNDLKLEFTSKTAGPTWEILKVAVDFEFDNSAFPMRD